MNKLTKAAACSVAGAVALRVLSDRLIRNRRRTLAGKVVLITGGSRGFGLAMAHRFASLGCRVALCARDEGELERARQILAQSCHEVFTVACDITDQHAVTTAVNAVTDHYGRIDILVNNAGQILVSPLENLEVADFDSAMDVMFRGMVYASLAVLPAMKARGQGRILNITSIGGKVSVPHLLSYSCAKAAAVAFSNGLRTEVGKSGVKVTTIIPGLMRTGSHVNALFKGNRSGEAAWFGAAASLPLISVSAESAARMAVDAACGPQTEKVLGVPALLLSRAQTLLPGLTSRILGLANSCLPEGRAGTAALAGHELDNSHGSLYRMLTTLGKRAGERLNQPV